MSATATYSISYKNIADSCTGFISFVSNNSAQVIKEATDLKNAFQKTLLDPSIEWAAEKAEGIFTGFITHCCNTKVDDDSYSLRKHTVKALSFNALSAFLSLNALHFFFGSLSLHGLLFWGALKLVPLLAINSTLTKERSPNPKNFFEFCGVAVFKNFHGQGLQSLAKGMGSQIVSWATGNSDQTIEMRQINP